MSDENQVEYHYGYQTLRPEALAVVYAPEPVAEPDYGLPNYVLAALLICAGIVACLAWSAIAVLLLGGAGGSLGALGGICIGMAAYCFYQQWRR